METTKNEIFFAVGVGLIAGVIATLSFTGKFKGISFQLKKKESTSAIVTSPISGQTVTKSPKIDNNFITLDQYEENYATSSAKLSGKTHSRALVIVSTETGDQAIVAKEGGEFAVDAGLVPGGNSIVIKSIAKNSEVSKELNLLYFPDSNN